MSRWSKASMPGSRASRCGGWRNASPQNPAERPLQFGAAVGVIPAAVREDDPLRVPADHGFDGGPHVRPLLPERRAKVGRCAAIGIAGAAEPGQEPHEGRCDFLALSKLWIRSVTTSVLDGT